MFTIKTKQKSPCGNLHLPSHLCTAPENRRRCTTGWHGLAPSDWRRQYFTSPGNTSRWGMHWGRLCVTGNIKITGSRKDTWITPLSSWHPKTTVPLRTVLQGGREKNRLFPEIRTITAHCHQIQRNGLLSKNSPKLKHTPDKHKEANRKISFSSDLRGSTVQAHHQY